LPSKKFEISINGKSYSGRIKLNEQGVNVIGVYRSIDDPNDVTVIIECVSTEVFDRIIIDRDRLEKLLAAQFISPPEYTILTKVPI
jgi:hypothetical protein